jgi:hypothetical protein
MGWLEHIRSKISSLLLVCFALEVCFRLLTISSYSYSVHTTITAKSETPVKPLVQLVAEENEAEKSNDKSNECKDSPPETALTFFSSKESRAGNPLQQQHSSTMPLYLVNLRLIV